MQLSQGHETMISQLQTNNPKILGFKLSGTLHDQDYRTFVPAVDVAVAAANGKVRLFVELDEFHGWDLHGAWDDFKFGVKHYSDVERIALVGDREWEEWMAKLWKPFTKSVVRYFDISKTEQAWAWLKEGL